MFQFHPLCFLLSLTHTLSSLCAFIIFVVPVLTRSSVDITPHMTHLVLDGNSELGAAGAELLATQLEHHRALQVILALEGVRGRCVDFGSVDVSSGSLVT